jgi:hypothetical protein
LKFLALGFYKDDAPTALRKTPKKLRRSTNRNAVAAFSPALP